MSYKLQSLILRVGCLIKVTLKCHTHKVPNVSKEMSKTNVYLRKSNHKKDPNTSWKMMVCFIWLTSNVCRQCRHIVNLYCVHELIMSEMVRKEQVEIEYVVEKCVFF